MTTTTDQSPAGTPPGTPHDPDTLAGLRAAVRGPVLVPGDAGYADEVATFNLAVVHHPSVVVGATGTEDVAAAVRWAAARDLPIAVHATGHGPIRPVEGGALLVTTARMAAVAVDPAQATATVRGGARWSDVLAAAEPHGLSAVTGSSSQVGVIGFSLGGGMGPLSRRYGFGADRVRSVEIVTADGRVRCLGPDSDPDLFWAVRGGKGNFGVVTAVEIALVPVPTVHAGALVFDGGSAASVLHSFRTWSATLPDEASTSVALVNLPPVETVPEPLRGRLVVMLRFALDGTDEEAAALLAPMRDAGRVLLDGVSRIPSRMVDVIHQDPTDPAPTWERGSLLSGLPAPAVDALLEVAGPGRGHALAMVELRLMGGAVGRPATPPNAVAGREGAYSLFTLGVLAPEVAAEVPAAGDRVHEALSPWGTGTALVNFLGGDTTPEQLLAAWRPEDRERLLRVKHAVDPHNLFRFGHALVG
jgi:FAD/FMN-containing dehydrogenase